MASAAVLFIAYSEFTWAGALCLRIRWKAHDGAFFSQVAQHEAFVVSAEYIAIRADLCNDALPLWNDHDRMVPLDQQRLAAFKADLPVLSRTEMFEKYVVEERLYGLPHVDQRTLRTTVAKRFAISIDDVVIVGSAKLGFTLTFKRGKNKTEKDRPPFSPFSDRSDVDIAIVSDRLFDEVWKQCFEFWQSSGYAKSPNYWPRAQHFRDYVFRGWMRPDFLPTEASVALRDNWFDYFRSITNAGLADDYPIKAGLYRERYYLERYQWQSLDKALDWNLS